jgi:ubiquinone/menaquinone biosynthesis C-methylase UbiE
VAVEHDRGQRRLSSRTTCTSGASSAKMPGMAVKDLFSETAEEYARYRPSYPPALFAWLAEQSPSRLMGVDVGTGNGQAAVGLASHFDRVIAIDASEEQLVHALPHARVEYRRAEAERTGLREHSADLMLAAQSFHWFKQDEFFAEVNRVLWPGGLLALSSYQLPVVGPAVDRVIYELYHDYLGKYWEPERRLVDNGYRTVEVPLPEIDGPVFDMRLTWTLDHLFGYLSTWSPLRKYREQEGHDPIERVSRKLTAAWGNQPTRVVIWPFTTRAFRRPT